MVDEVFKVLLLFLTAGLIYYLELLLLLFWNTIVLLAYVLLFLKGVCLFRDVDASLDEVPIGANYLP